jgi:pimeloyl-ACP methyl ester carboxylesterase
MQTTPFRIDVKPAILDDLRERLARTRWPEGPPHADWSMGADVAFMKKLATHWLERYDWRAQQDALNVHPQFTAEVGGTRLHFVHARSRNPHAVPLLLIHSFPDSFYRFHKVVERLTDTFHVVVPSLPGFGFSGGEPQTVDDCAETLAALMEGLGYTRYVAGGGDGPVPMAMSQRHPDRVRGIYVVDVGYPDGSEDFASLSPPEQQFAQWIGGWWMREGAFNMIQSTKPQSLAFALHDSPTGLAAWLMILFSSGSTTGDELEARFSLDELITNIMIYWVTGTIGSSMRNYLVNARATYSQPPKPRTRSSVPAAMARLPLDAPVPREWAERRVHLVQFTEMDKGGHFSSWEVPEAFCADLRAFVQKLPPSSR